MKKIFIKLLLVGLITAVYAFGEDFVKNFYNDIFTAKHTVDIKYCYAYWAPHGEYWQDNCYNKKKECDKSLDESKSMGRRNNAEKCYKQEFVDAYCVYQVNTGNKTYDDVNKEMAYSLINVCTLDISECQKYEKYSVTNSHCEKKTDVNTKESETLYLTPKQELENIVNKNIDTSSDIKKSESEEKTTVCTKYKAAPNQQKAFENLSLNWNKTKKWGAFVDVDGNLRANKPSCRLIERGTTEYNKYK